MSNGFYSMDYPGEFLEHHGIKGQKWGVRNYQYADGSLTEAGRARYYKPTYENAMTSNDRHSAIGNNYKTKEVNRLDKLANKDINKYGSKLEKLERKHSIMEAKGKSDKKLLKNEEKQTKVLAKLKENMGIHTEKVKSIKDITADDGVRAYKKELKRGAITTGVGTLFAGPLGGAALVSLRNAYGKNFHEVDRVYNNSVEFQTYRSALKEISFADAQREVKEKYGRQ